jgi:hypothetical protein
LKDYENSESENLDINSRKIYPHPSPLPGREREQSPPHLRGRVREGVWGGNHEIR